MKTKLIGCTVFLFVVIGVILSSGHLTSFIDFTGIAFVVIAACGLSLMRYKKGDGRENFFKSLKKYAIPCGILGCLIGTIHIALHSLNTGMVNPANVFGGFGVALLTVFYGLILYFIIDALTEGKPIN